ncbi:MAG: GntR family transcriptional regulator [Burkholderiaceae bacterium]|nr:GntR family transcriptional regulator [Burkholderiaceae bacterium]
MSVGTIPDLSDDTSVSQTVRAQLRLRELIIGGVLEPGRRIAELALVERLGVSRTPIRMALVRLEEEGLLEALPGGGFVVKVFSEDDIHDAIELRGTLEGLAVRLAAERGAPARLLAQAQVCVDRLDDVLAPAVLDTAALAAYIELNGRLHEQLAEMAGSEVVARQLTRVKTLPFASPNSLVVANAGEAAARDALVVAQAQHRAVIDAISRREGARAEALMREHARIAQHNLNAALLSQPGPQRLPGASLIRRMAAR